MRTRICTALAATTVLAVVLVSCDAGPKEPPADSAASSRPGARTLPIPDRQPTSAQPPPGAIPLPPAGAGQGKLALTWKAPSAWVEEPPTSSMRRAQYRVPGPGGDGECVVYYFGPGQGGDAAANAARWATQFKQADGRPSDELMKTTKLEVPGIDVLAVEISGTYAGGMTMTAAPAEEKPGYMLLGAIAAGPDSNWFFKLTGPKATIEAQRADFEGMLRSLEVGK